MPNIMEKVAVLNTELDRAAVEELTPFCVKKERGEKWQIKECFH